MEELNKDNFDENALKGKTVVDFWAPWCGPCKIMGPAFESSAQENDGVNFYKVNVDDEPELSGGKGIRSIPTIVFYQDGEEKGREVGAMSKEKINEKVQEIFG